MTLSRLILGLLSLAPMTGYELKKHFDATISHFWNADKAQIYRTLTSLVRDGLSEVQTVEQRGYPSRQVHHLTDAGRVALQEWLASEPLPETERNAFLGQVFFAARLSTDESLRLLEGRKATAERYLAELQQQLSAQPPAAVGDPRYFQLATLRNGIRHVQAELEWLHELESELA